MWESIVYTPFPDVCVGKLFAGKHWMCEKYEVRLIKDLTSLRKLKKQYVALHDKQEESTPFVSYEWVETTIEVYLKNSPLYIVTVWDKDILVAVLPTVIERKVYNRIPVRELCVIGRPLADRLCILSAVNKEIIIPLMLDSILALSKEYDVIAFNELYSDLEISIISAYSKKHGIGSYVRHSSTSPFLTLGFSSEAEIFNSYKKSLRTRLKRIKKKISGFRFERKCLFSKEEVTGIISQLKHLEDLSWKGSASVGIFSQKDKLEFFTKLSEKFASRGWLDISCLYSDDELVSYRYGFSHSKVFYDYSLSFDPKYSKSSPGRNLLELIIKDSFNRGYIKIDASRGKVQQKHMLCEFSNSEIFHYDVMLFTNSIKAKVLFILNTKVKPFVKKMKA